MFKIVSKRNLGVNVNEYVIDAPAVARNARPGQFVILRVEEKGERVPFTICDANRIMGTVTILVQTVGATTRKLAALKEGDYIPTFVGPLGNPTELSHYNGVLLIAGGIGSAVIYPQAKVLYGIGKPADVILGARTKDLVMYKRELSAYAKKLYVMTDDGSDGEQGFVTQKLKELLEGGARYEMVMAVGPLGMMKAVCEVTKQYNIPTTVSMNSVMVDGTGMCGGCRLTVGGKTRYACVDGPEFDGHLVDFDEAMARASFYKNIEKDHLCKLREAGNEN
ncbi:MAG TPA: sulfide/dihydroorotate dehydrogenase-like FAD/NAD-binding protein [Clostridia bacterium]|jgi:ferredoxin--NADP+ reductase|nr:sulfide/dihydroorotate dehydrogenase-like FAD/NAD-binding protein [Clostridia bacterium]HOL60510.1 sulfide/dihydroorotate dehydrogenase-like FAD/NAD-binding protein [Clostridia bacterium]HPO52917.1 sulfide/dihydroorotate dehydrogenase-like FAD/NAD-binding protein [Clostridia bacterium]